METVTLRAPAKINLTLDVKGKRADGYHDIESVMHQVSLCDTVTISRVPEGIKISCTSPEVPAGEENLAYRAARLVLSQFNIKSGIHIHIEKCIPVAAGLAGGSSNSAAVIKGMNELFELGLSQKDMLSLGLRLGSDVPFCISGGTAVASGRGEILEPVKIRRSLDFVLVNPGFAVSTGEVYRLLDQEIITERPDSRKLTAALAEGDLEQIAANLGNVMEQVVLKRHPAVQEIKERLLKEGALAALMSGSGPTVFGLFPSPTAADQALAAVQHSYPVSCRCASYI